MVHLRVVESDGRRGAAQPAAEGDILRAVYFVRDRRAHARAPGPYFVQDLALIGAERAEATVVDHLKHQVACRRRRPAADAAAPFDVPSQFLAHRIPGLQPPARAGRRLGTEGGLDRLGVARRANVAGGAWTVNRLRLDRKS